MSLRALSNRLACKARQLLHIAGLGGTAHRKAASIAALCCNLFLLAKKGSKQQPAAHCSAQSMSTVAQQSLHLQMEAAQSNAAVGV